MVCSCSVVIPSLGLAVGDEGGWCICASTL